MSESICLLKIKLAKVWSKLLKASALNKQKKIAKHEQRLIELELQLKQLREKR